MIGNAKTQLCDCVTMCHVMQAIHEAHPDELCFDDVPLSEELLRLAETI